MQAMRWPVARFMSALEQFAIPQATRVPCRRIRSQGGACFGQTCERDFKFSWECLNTSVPRQGMLAAFVRCLFDKSTAAQRRAAMLSDLTRMGRQSAPSPQAEAAMRRLVSKLEAEGAGAARRGTGDGGSLARARGREERPAVCGMPKTNDIPNFRLKRYGSQAKCV